MGIGVAGLPVKSDVHHNDDLTWSQLRVWFCVVFSDLDLNLTQLTTQNPLTHPFFWGGWVEIISNMDSELALGIQNLAPKIRTWYERLRFWLGPGTQRLASVLVGFLSYLPLGDQGCEDSSDSSPLSGNVFGTRLESCPFLPCVWTLGQWKLVTWTSGGQWIHSGF